MSYDAGTILSTTPNPSSGVQLYRFRYMFGHDQTFDAAGNAYGRGESWVSPIAYVLLLAAQIDLWNHFLLASYPNRQPTDSRPEKMEFATYCGAVEYMHARHNGGPHTRGNAIDVEYSRSPFLPMWAGPSSYTWDIYSSSYAGSADGTGPDSVYTRLVAPTVAIFDRACGQRSPTAPAANPTNFNVSTLDTAIDQIRFRGRFSRSLISSWLKHPSREPWGRGLSYDDSNNGPWFDGKTAWPDPKNGNVLV